MTDAPARLVAYQRDVVTLLFSADFEGAVRSLGARADRWRVYRRMARDRLAETIVDTFPRTESLLGARWRPLVDRFFDEAPPRSPFIRDIPSEFASWLLRPSSASLLEGVEPWAHDLVRFESANTEVGFAVEESGARETQEGAEKQAQGDDRVVPLAFDRPAVLTPAHRIVAVSWSVHHLPYDELPIDRTRVVARTCTLLIHRDAETHGVLWLELSPFSAALLAEVAREDQPLVEAVKRAAASVNVAIDEALVVSLSAFVEDLMRRRVWLGSLASA